MIINSNNYNVLDKYKNLTKEEIKQDLQQNKLPCSVLIQNIQQDLNFGNIVRSSNNFNVSEIFYFGKRHADRRGCCGAYHYSPVQYLETIDQVLALKNNYNFVAIENNINRPIENLLTFKHPDNPLFIFGEEGCGLSSELLDLADYIVEIPSKGSIRSLNVGSTASIVLYDFYSKYEMSE